VAKCAICDKTVVLGGVKDAGVFYCSPACRFREFFPRFEAALARAAASDPSPMPLAAPSAKAGEPGGEEDGFSTGAGRGGDAFVILLGLGALAAFAFLIYYLVLLVGYPFHAQTFWFVVPIGAFLCGMAAGSGFWLALRSFNRLPTGWTYWAAVLGGAFSYVLIYVFMWWLLEFQGVKVRDVVGFPAFLQSVLEHQRIHFGRAKGEGVELGKWGYPRFAINVVGFAMGVLTTVLIGGGKAYCPKCRRYLKTVGKQVRSSSNPEETAAALYPVIFGVSSGRLQEAVERHAASGTPGSKEFWTTTIVVEACPGCEEHHATLTASVPGERGPQAVNGFVFHGTSEHPVRFLA